MDLEKSIQEIELLMNGELDCSQMARLHKVLRAVLVDGAKLPSSLERTDNSRVINDFLGAKRLEGCSERTLGYYRAVLERFAKESAKPFVRMSTEDIRGYLSDYQARGTAINTTVDNVRRVISSLFSWLEVEGFIYKSPVRRIKKIKATKSVKPVISDESLVVLREACSNIRDAAIVDLLNSSGIRVGELVKLNRDDVDLVGRECVVLGKGDKQRKAYFDARTKVHLVQYLASRTDSNPALFVSLNAPFERLGICGVESRLRKLGHELGLAKIHPHKFRRTMATRAIEKGMPIEQVQLLLGHNKIETTLCYAMVSQQSAKIAHRKYLG